MTKDEIKQSTSMNDVLSKYGLYPNRSGFIVCPFHKDKNPSMKIYKDSFYCFGCGEHGDIFDFVMKYENIPFSSAFLELGGTYLNKKGKSRNEIRHEIRDIKSKKNENSSLYEIDQIKKNVLMYETALKTFPSDSEEWYMCQFELEKQKSMYKALSKK